MPQGLEVFDGTGAGTFNTTERFGSILGSLNPMTASGSIPVPKFANGQPFFILTARTSWTNTVYTKPSVSITGNSITWSGGSSFWSLRWGVR